MIGVDIDKLCNFFQSVDRIIASRKNLRVIAARMLTPGATNGVTIKLEYEMLKGFLLSKDIKKFMVIKGVNYHELAHCLFSGLPPSTIRREVREIYNILEDGRIESIFSILYPRAKSYFKASFYSLINPSENDVSTYFLLVYSRRFVLDNPKLLKLAEKQLSRIISKEHLEKIKKLVDEFLNSVEPYKRVIIATDIYNILNFYKGKIEIPQKLLTPDYTGEFDSSHSSSVKTDLMKKLTKQLESKLRDYDKRLRAEMKKIKPLENKNEEIDEGLAETIEMMEISEEEVENIKEEVYDEVLRDMSAIFKSAGGSSQIIVEKLGKGRIQRSKKAMVFKQKLYLNLKQIKQEEDYGWLPNQRVGKIDLRKLMRSNSIRIFKKWKTGSLNKFKADVIGLIDISGSMSSYVRVLKDILLGLGDALEQVNLGRFGLAAFSNYYAVVKKLNTKNRNEEGLYKLRSGGTTILPCLRRFVFEQFMHHSTSKRKYLLIFSDGYFWDDPNSIRYEFSKLKAIGVKTIIITPESSSIRRIKDVYGSNIIAITMKDYDFDKLAKFLKDVLEGNEIRGDKYAK